MNKIVLFILMGLYASGAFAGSKTDSVKNYYKLINQAELAIVDSNYATAHKKYATAFQYKFPNDKDLENALLISCLLRDTTKATYYITKMAALGFFQYTYKSQTQPGAFLPTDLDSAFVQLISKDCDSFYKLSVASSLSGNMHRWAVLYSSDQAIRNIEFKDKADEMQVGSLVDSGNAELMKIFLLDGYFPSFEKTGYFWDGDGHPSNRAGEPFFALYWHQRGRKAGNDAIDSLILSAVYKGDFRPDCWAICNSMRPGMTQRLGLNIRTHTLESYTSSELAQINKNREQYLLEPLEDFYKKAAFQQRKLKDPHNPYFRFYNTFMFIVR